MTTCAECRYHHDRGCYIAPVSVFRLATAPACAQIATITAHDAPGTPQRTPTPPNDTQFGNAIPNPYGRITAKDTTA